MKQQESLIYKKLDNQMVACRVCSHFCKIAPSKRGICGVRENQNGKLVVLNYGQIIAAHIDPIEKKPLYHFLPGTKTYSIAALGCNFRCLNCQNFSIACPEDPEYSGDEGPPPDIALAKSRRAGRGTWGDKLSPPEVIKNAINNNCPSISYTYTEPTIFVEFALECMKLAKNIRTDSQLSNSQNSQPLKNIWVSNGFMSPETLKIIAPYLDAINVDLKSFSDEFYQKICGARLQPILDNLKQIARLRPSSHSGRSTQLDYGGQEPIHLEVTTLIIPGYNDSAQELENIAKFICNELGADVPWHVSRFFPHYKMSDTPPTPVEKIYEAVKIGKRAGLKFVHAGNI